MAKPHHQPCRLEQCPSLQLDNPGKWTLQGHSRAGERTGFVIKDHGIVLDAGLATYKAPKAVFITHSHCDHTLCFPQLLSGRLSRLKGQEGLRGRPVYCPAKIMGKINLLIFAVHVLSSDNIFTNNNFETEQIESAQGYHLFGVSAGEYYDIPGVPNIRAEIHQAYHSDQNCLGYGFSSVCRKLKDEYSHLKKAGGQELSRLRKEGVEITEEIVTPELIFFCDSSIDNLRQHNGWKKYPVVVCECTGYSPYQEADKMYAIEHSHMDDLKPIILDNLDKQWIIIHPSMAVPDSFLEEEEVNLRENHGANVTLWKSENAKFTY